MTITAQLAAPARGRRTREKAGENPLRRGAEQAVTSPDHHEGQGVAVSQTLHAEDPQVAGRQIACDDMLWHVPPAQPRYQQVTFQHQVADAPGPSAVDGKIAPG